MLLLQRADGACPAAALVVGIAVHIDITPLARSWATHPETNFGLMMLGENEDLKASTETICQTQFVHAGDR